MNGPFTVLVVEPYQMVLPATKKLGAKDVYDLNKLADIKQWCYDNGRSFWEYVEKCESEDIWDYLDMVWQTMKQSIRNGFREP